MLNMIQFSQIADELAALVLDLMLEAGDADAGPRAHGAGFEHSRAARKRIAGKHRLLPFHEVDAGRTLRMRIEEIAVGHHAHEECAGVPAGRCKPAEDACAPGGFVHVHRLRIEFAREFDNLLRRHGDRA